MLRVSAFTHHWCSLHFPYSLFSPLHLSPFCINQNCWAPFLEGNGPLPSAYTHYCMECIQLSLSLLLRYRRTLISSSDSFAFLVYIRFKTYHFTVSIYVYQIPLSSRRIYLDVLRPGLGTLEFFAETKRVCPPSYLRQKWVSPFVASASGLE